MSRLWIIFIVLLAGCTFTPARLIPTPPQNPTEVITATASSVLVQQIATITPVKSTPTPTLAQSATQITPIVTSPSEGLENFSSDSHWLPYIDFNAQTLHFYNTSKSFVCDFPFQIHYTSPDHFIVWLPDGRVVVQAADRVSTGLPCGNFKAATPQEIRTLDHSDPAFSPAGRYQVVTQSLKNGNMSVTLKEVSSGKVEVQTTIPALAGKSSPGFWLDTSHYLIDQTCDRGPLLLAPGKPVLKIATDLFHLPVKPASGAYDCWMARSDVENLAVSKFHLMLIPIFGSSNLQASNPLQIYHSETGQVETLPYLASQDTFSNDGHWLLVSETNNLGQPQVMIRSIDPPGGTFQPFNDTQLPLTTWSPDGGRYYQVSQDLTTIAVYAYPGNTLLGRWQAPDYELSPAWSPDGKYLAAWARDHTDFKRESIFVIQVPG